MMLLVLAVGFIIGFAFVLVLLIDVVHSWRGMSAGGQIASVLIISACLWGALWCAWTFFAALGGSA